MCFLVQTVNTRAQAGHKLLEVQPALRVMGLVRVTRMVHLVKVAQIPWQDTELVVVAVIMGVAQAALRVLGEEVVTRALLPPRLSGQSRRNSSNDLGGLHCGVIVWSGCSGMGCGYKADFSLLRSHGLVGIGNPIFRRWL